MRKRRENLRENFKMLEENQETTNRGITLIALVVTIVVLLILASVSITVVFGDNGILQLAKEAGEKTNEAVQNDKENIGNATNYIKSLSWDTTKVTAVTTKDGAIVPVPKGFVGSEVDGENTIKDGFVIYEGDSAVTNENVDTSKAREERNQFVWVPADGVNLEYKQDKETWKEEESDDYNDYNDWWDEEEIDFRKESVKKYGGFYVARYEAGVPGSIEYGEETNYKGESNLANRNKSADQVTKENLPASRKGLQAWNYVSPTNAKDLSENMYADSTSVTSRLIDSYAWDTICRWFSNSGINVTDSTSWGNYTDADSGENVNGLYSKHELAKGGWPPTDNDGNYGRGKVSFEARDRTAGKIDIYELATGISERNKAKNIYDFAGNMWEYTTEVSENTGFVVRGGSFTGPGGLIPASFRDYATIEEVGKSRWGFRAVLYLK